MADGNTRSSGSEDNHNDNRQANGMRLPSAAHLELGTWNCGGLSKVKLEMVKDCNLDIICPTETQSCTNIEKELVLSDEPPQTDSWSGVALLFNKRTLKYVTHSGTMGSRIVWCRLFGRFCNFFIIGVYIPQRQRTNPDQNATYDQLQKLLGGVNKSDCVIILGDFNSRLARNTTKHVGRWCIHRRMDSGGERLLDIMKTTSLKAINTYFQPSRRHNNATYINIQPEKPPSQIDHILISSRWASAVRSCKVKWGISIKAYGRKYDHGLVSATVKLRLKCQKTSKRKDFSALRQPEIANIHEECLKAELAKTSRPITAEGKLQRLNFAMIKAQTTLPDKEPTNSRKWETSESTMNLVHKRSMKWAQMSEVERKSMNRVISRSARADYRKYVESVIDDIEEAGAVGKSSTVFKLAKKLKPKGKGNSHCQPSIDAEGKPITSTEQQLEAWAKYLQTKFAARPDEATVNCNNLPGEEDPPNLNLEEVTKAVKNLNWDKATGPDSIPIEQYKNNNTAIEELYDVLLQIWTDEGIPEIIVLADMLMLYKKKCKDDRGNYRALGLLNHTYKVFATILLTRIAPYIEPKLSEMQAGYRPGRGTRDNILILNMAINHLLSKSKDHLTSLGVITYIDFVAAFDSILHSYLLTALKRYGVPSKYCRIIKEIYKSVAVRVRIQESGGTKSYSRSIPVRRGAIQGDIPSPECFLASLDMLLKDHGGTDVGIPITPKLLLEDLEFADDAALPDTNVSKASVRLTNLDNKAQQLAGMSISIPKTKVQHIMKRPKLSKTTEEDIDKLPQNLQFQHKCEQCNMTYPTKHGLAVHKGRWCKGKRGRKPSRAGTVADRVVQKHKVEEHQKTLDKVTLNGKNLDNVYTCVYLGTELAGDGDNEIMMKHRSNIATGRFGEYKTTLTTTKLPLQLRLRLYSALIASTMTYASEAWILTDTMKRHLNHVNSKFLSMMTKRSIHEEAKSPSFDIKEYVSRRRWNNLGHVLRLDENKPVRQYLLELSPKQAPYVKGTLLDDTKYRTVEEMIKVASNRNKWKAAWKTMCKR